MNAHLAMPKSIAIRITVAIVLTSKNLPSPLALSLLSGVKALNTSIWSSSSSKMIGGSVVKRRYMN